MDTLHFERFEWKYFVPETQVEAVRRFIAPYVRLDRHAANSPDRRYTIHSVYLDTPDLALWHAGANDLVRRFKLRVRWYDGAAGGPFFCEVKRKLGQVIVKDRATVGRETAAALLTGQRVALPEGGVARYLAEFADRVTRISAAPVMHVRYTREAYESAFREYARLTFDRAMRFQRIGADPLLPAPAAWRCIDVPFATESVREAVLIELKFSREFPRWMADLVAEFGLVRCGFSKYSQAIAREQARRLGGPELHRVARAGG